jgi:hypothetical protein
LELFAKETLAPGYKPVIIRLTPFMARGYLSATNIFGDIIICLVPEK